MVVTSLAVPTSASAATATKVVKQGGGTAPAVLYVGDKGTDYGLSKTFKGNKYTWTISNSAIATINKSGVVTAKAPGTVTIKATARNSKGKWLAAFTHKVKVNLRATSVDIGADDFTLVMGQEKDLNAVKTPAKSTDALKYVSDNTEVATVDAKTGVVKTVGVGEATITVLSKAVSTSADTSKYNKKDTVKVTVVDGIQSIKQTTPTKFEVTFATDQSKKLTSGDLTVTDADGVKQIIKGLGFSADGKTATVELYLELSDSAVYKVAYGTTEKTFTASKGDVASVVVEGKTVQYAKPTEFSVKLLDKNGVDVTTSTKLGYVTFDSDNLEAFVGLNGNNKPEITIYNFPKTVNVTATYHTYDYKDGDEVTFKGTGVFNSVEEIKATASDITYTIAPSNVGADWTAIKTSIPASAYDYQVYVKAKDGDTDLTEGDFTFESSDTNILSVSEDGRIYAIKAGSAYIKATYGATSRMLAVTVGVESKVTEVTADNKLSTFYYVPAAAINSNTAGMVDNTKTIKVTAKDQYGNTKTGNSITNVELVSSNMTSRGVNPFLTGSGDSYMNYVSGDEFTLTWNGTDAINGDNDGNYTFRLTYEGKQVVVTVKVVAVSNTTLSYINFDTQTTNLDAVLKADATSSTDKVLNVYGYNNAGQQITKYTSGVTFTATLDGDSYNTSATNSAVSVSPASVTVTALEFNGGSVATQAAVGTYEIKASATIGGITRTASSKVVIKNTQVNPVIKLEKKNVPSADVTTVLSAVNEAYSAKLNGTPLTISGAVVVAGNRPVNDTATALSNTSYTVKKIIVDQPVVVNGSTVTVSRTITVNGIISITN